MADVGKIAALITANPAGFAEGIKAAEDRLTGFQATAQKVSGSLSKMDLSGGLGAASSMMDRFGGLASAALNPLTLFAGAASLAAGGLYSLSAAGSKSIGEVHRLTRLYGMTTEAASGFAFAVRSVGGDVDGMDHALRHLQRHLSDAAAGSKEAEFAFAALGLKSEDLASLPMDQSLGLILDQLRLMPNAADRTAASFRLLGRSGREVERLISGGSQALRQAQQDAERLGISVTPEQVRSVRQATLASRRAEAVTGSVGQSFAQAAAIAFAPASKQFSEMWTQMIFDLQPGFEVLRGAIRGLGTAASVAVGVFGGVVRVATEFGSAVGAAVNYIGSRIPQGAQSAFQGIGGNLQLPPGQERPVMQLPPLTTRQLELLAQPRPGAPGRERNEFDQAALHRELLVMGRQLPQIGQQTPPTALQARRAEQAAHYLEQQEQALEQRRQQMALTNNLVPLETMTRYNAAVHFLSETQTNALVAIQDYTARFEEEIQLRQRANNIIQQGRTPLERLNEGFMELFVLGGRGALSTEQFGRALIDQVTAAERALGLDAASRRSPTAVEQGSREAYSAELRYQMQGQQEDWQQRILAILQAQAESDRARQQIQRDMLRAIEERGFNVLGGF